MWSKEDIKTDEDLNQYGWEMRLIQIDNDLYLLNQERDKVLTFIEKSPHYKKQSVTNLQNKPKETKT